MKFNLEEHKGKYVMHCKTLEEAKDFCKFLDANDRCWSNKRSYLEINDWEVYKNSTAYFFNEGTIGNIYYNYTNTYRILEWSDYMNKEFTFKDLQVGDFFLTKLDKNLQKVDCRCLCNYIAQKDTNTHTIVYVDSCGDWHSQKYTDKLDCVENLNYSIVTVRRLSRLDQNVKHTFDENKGELLYERYPIKEMTLEEVCEALGQEIKIVKKH